MEMVAKQAERGCGAEAAKEVPQQGHGEPESQLSSTNSLHIEAGRKTLFDI